MNRVPPIRAVLFDLGGVWLRLRSWPEACAVAAKSHPGIGQDAGRLSLMDDHPEVAKAHLEFECGRLETDEFMRQTARILGADPSVISAVFCARIAGPYPGTHDLLDQLHAAGLATGCLSNTNALHWSLMLGLFGDDAPARIPLERLHHRFASQDLGCAKPHAAIYAAAENLLQLPGDKIAFFDDREDNIAGAAARGWHAHRIDPAGAQSPAEQMANYLTAMGVLS